jgi:hypothetical protein
LGRAAHRPAVLGGSGESNCPSTDWLRIDNKVHFLKKKSAILKIKEISKINFI